MEPVQIYALAAGGMFVLAFFYRVSSFISHWVQDRTLFFVFKYLLYPMLIRRSRFFSPLSRWRAILLLLYSLGTAICNTVGAKSILQVGKRAGTLAILHFIPLLFSDRMGFAADLLGISLRTYVRLHASVGIMALIQSLIHIVIVVSHHSINLKDSFHFHGFLVRKSSPWYDLGMLIQTRLRWPWPLFFPYRSREVPFLSSSRKLTLLLQY